MKIKPTSEKAKSASKVSSRSHLGERVPRLRFPGFGGEWKFVPFGSIIRETNLRTNIENEDILLSAAIEGMFLNSELFDHQRGASNKGYKKIKLRTLVLSTQNLHLGNANVNLRFEHGIVSPAYKTYEVVGCDPVLLGQWVKTGKAKKFFFDATTVGASVCRRNVEWDTLYQQQLCLPTENEQHKLADFLSLLTDRISSQQRLVELLKKHKRGLVQDLFTSELSKLPRCRFAGFKDAWTSRSFDEVFSFLKNNTLPRSEMTTAGGMIRNVHYGDVLIKYGDVLDCNRDQIPFLVSNKQSDDCRLLQDGDVVIADTAEDEAVGKTVELVGVADKLIESGLHTIACRPKISFAPRFLGYYLNSTTYRRQLLPLMQGIKVLSLSKSQLGKTQLLFPPDINEQKRIAELLTGIDAHIAMAQSHLDNMQSLKTGFLQQLFV
ncbi:MAG: restriction endonuclease subunit S [Kiritimatiellae bacterium]|nr:restriction endonuclease subunit S [Kiritimatiellia bacterium]